MREFCVDLEIAKELKENGFPQETNYVHNTKEYSCTGGLLTELEFILRNKLLNNSVHCYSAPTSDELLKELPNIIDKDKFLVIEKVSWDIYKVGYPYYVEQVGVVGTSFKDKKLSNALAKIYIYLKKEGYIK